MHRDKENYNIFKLFSIIYGVHENISRARLFMFNYNCFKKTTALGARKCCFTTAQEKNRIC